MKSGRQDPHSGFTLIELMIVLALIGVVLVKGVVIMRTTTEVASRESSEMAIEDQARILLDRIALAVLACDRESLDPILNPGHSTEVRYQASLGVEDGEVVWAAPETIRLDGAANDEVAWLESPGLPEERSVTWSRLVQPLLEGEVLNGVDDNGNGLVDEQGLTFFVDRNMVTIRLSLGRMGRDGVMTLKTVETSVTVRNNPQTAP